MEGGNKFRFLGLAIGIALVGYFIGNGLKNVRNPKGILETVEEYDTHELISQSNVHYFMGISKEGAAKLIEEHPDIPPIMLTTKFTMRRQDCEIGYCF